MTNLRLTPPPIQAVEADVAFPPNFKLLIIDADKQNKFVPNSICKPYSYASDWYKNEKLLPPPYSNKLLELVRWLDIFLLSLAT